MHSFSMINIIWVTDDIAAKVSDVAHGHFFSCFLAKFYFPIQKIENTLLCTACALGVKTYGM